MKDLELEKVGNFRKELKANLENCGVCCDIHILTTWYDEKVSKDYHGTPTSTYNDNSERVMIKEAIELDLRGTYAVYVDVQFDSVSIWKPNNENKCFDFVNVFWFEDYKNKTSLSMALAMELVTIANSVKED